MSMPPMDPQFGRAPAPERRDPDPTEPTPEQLRQEIAARDRVIEAQQRAMQAPRPAPEPAPAPPVIEDPGEMPDPATQPEEFRRWLARDRLASEQRIGRQIQETEQQATSRVRADMIVSEFKGLYPQYAQLEDEVRLEFGRVVDELGMGNALPQDASQLHARVAERMKQRLDRYQQAMPKPPAPKQDNALEGLGGRSGAPASRSTPDGKTAPTMTDQLKKIQSEARCLAGPFF